jgi:hypothetical protein
MSTSLKNFSYALILALGATAAGCAADSPDGDGGGGGGGGTGSDDAPRAMDASGRYQVSSTFDIAANMPGKVGEVTNTFINMTDGANDPAEWILEQVIANVNNSFIKSALNTAKPFISGYLNQRLLQIAPDFVDTILQVGQDFGQVARNFGLNEQLDVTGSGTAYTATVNAVGVKFTIDQQSHDIVFADHMIAPVSAAGVGLTLDATGKIDIAEHKLPLSYGKVLRLGLDEVIIPALSPTATNLQTLLPTLVNCQQVGAAIADAIYDFSGLSISDSVGQGACTVGLGIAATTIYSKIDGIDSSALEFGLTGVARGIDSDADRRMDRIQTGQWTGTLSYGGTPAPLAAATFLGQRM